MRDANTLIVELVRTGLPVAREAADLILSLAAERDAALERAHYAEGVASLAMKHRDDAERARDGLRSVIVRPSPPTTPGRRGDG